MRSVMRSPARLGLGLILSVLAPVAALAGGHARSAPMIVRPGLHAPAASAPRVIQVATRPVYAPPGAALYGPPRNNRRHGLRHRGWANGLAGLPAVYQPAIEPAAAAPPAAPTGEYPRPRASVVYNVNGPLPLWQGDAGYVAQPVIYNVNTVLRRYPLTGMEPSLVK